MCYGYASIFYGLFVQSSDLLVAATAWKDLAPTFLAVDLIRSRRSSGNLSVEGGSRVGDLPEEVWEMVKYELAGLGVEHAGMDLFFRSVCYDCLQAGTKLGKFREIFECTTCYSMYRRHESTRGLFEERGEVRNLFLLFRLRAYMPSRRNVKLLSKLSTFTRLPCASSLPGPPHTGRSTLSTKQLRTPLPTPLQPLAASFRWS